MKTTSRAAPRNPANTALSGPRLALTFRLQVALEEQQRLERAARIKQLREESPYTQEAIADRIHVKLRTYQKWEEGGGITWEHLESLAELHSVDVQWIHRGQEKGATPDPFAEPAYVTELREQLDRIEADLADLVAESDATAALESEARERESETKPRGARARRASSS